MAWFAWIVSGFPPNWAPFCQSRFGAKRTVNRRFRTIRANRWILGAFCESIRANRFDLRCELPGDLSLHIVTAHLKCDSLSRCGGLKSSLGHKCQKCQRSIHQNSCFRTRSTNDKRQKSAISGNILHWNVFWIFSSGCFSTSSCLL